MELDTASSDTDDFSDGSSIGVGTLNPSRLLQNALRHIDGLIENCEENKRHSPVNNESKLLVLSTELRVHIEELEQLQCDNESDVPEETLKVIYNWSKRQLGVQVCMYCAVNTETLQELHFVCVYTVSCNSSQPLV